jgi:long-chain acyl-CoA synthetase
MDTLVDFDQMPTLGAIAVNHARERPRAIALAFEGRQTDFAEFDRRTNQVAQALLAQGITHGRRICYVGKNSDHYFELLFGAGKGAEPRLQ